MTWKTVSVKVSYTYFIDSFTRGWSSYSDENGKVTYTETGNAMALEKALWKEHYNFIGSLDYEGKKYLIDGSTSIPAFFVSKSYQSTVQNVVITPFVWPGTRNVTDIERRKGSDTYQYLFSIGTVAEIREGELATAVTAAERESPTFTKIITTSENTNYNHYNDYYDFKTSGTDSTILTMNKYEWVQTKILLSLFTMDPDEVDFRKLTLGQLDAVAENGDNFIYAALRGDDRVQLPDIVSIGGGFTYDFTRTFFGGAGNDEIRGGKRGDSIDGEEDDDKIYGNGGNDLLLGGDGEDVLRGGSDNDRLYGNADDDVLDGGDGADRMDGGDGVDLFFLDDLGDTFHGLTERGETIVLTQGAMAELSGFASPMLSHVRWKSGSLEIVVADRNSTSSKAIVVPVTGDQINKAFAIRSLPDGEYTNAGDIGLTLVDNSSQILNGVRGNGHSDAFVDALLWGWGAWKPGTTISWYLGSSAAKEAAIEVHGETREVNENSAIYKWTADATAAFKAALALFSHVTNLKFKPATSVETANLVSWIVDLPPNADGKFSGGRAEVPAQVKSGVLWQYFHPYDTMMKSKLQPGSFGFSTLVHEIGHSLGLAHSHDGGAEGDRSKLTGSLAQFDNSVNTTMSYKLGEGAWKSVTYGNQGGLGAFDIAALQTLYGTKASVGTESKDYKLPQKNALGVGWSTIWDTDKGDQDTISSLASSKATIINLNDATLDPKDPNAGGAKSRVEGVNGGLTIAKGVIIENAVGGYGNDKIIGNEFANKINGHRGIDTLRGGLGNDTFIFDVAPGAANADIILDFNPVDDRIQLDDRAYTMVGAPGILKASAFVMGTKAKDGSDRIIYDKATGNVYYDADGNLADGAHLIATLTNNPTISYLDFFVV